MSMFWPKDVEIKDTQSPIEILKNAKEEWESQSSSVMTLILQDSKTSSGDMKILVHAKHVPENRTVTLFSVIHRSSEPYPVTIQPISEELPQYLKKSYYQPSALDSIQSIGSGKNVENSWVSDMPSEFRENLARAFNLGVVKRTILNLLSKSANSTEGDSDIDDEFSDVEN